jgi:predicted acyl esterase
MASPIRSLRHVLVLLVVVALVAACSGGGGSKPAAAPAPAITERGTFEVGGSIGQVWVTDARDGQVLVLADRSGREVARGRADRLGSLIFRDVAPAAGYTVRALAGSAVAGSAPVRVLSTHDRPPASLYRQRLRAGLNYVRVRDGISLAVTVRLPLGVSSLDDGPFPTVVEYSGYQVAAPHDLLQSILAGLTSGRGLDIADDPLMPSSSTAVGSLIAPVLGYASVSIQMRGSGCSGGDFQLFDWPSIYDGYDVIETVAAQPWVLHHAVGMVGISFSGLSQIPVAGTRPPHLAAIAPLSVTDDLYAGIGYPGGIFNNGFARSWLEERMANARPAPAEGAQPYARALVEQGDRQCAQNQKLRLQTQDVFEIIRDHPYREPSIHDHRSAWSWASRVSVPTFLAGATTDEQTGAHFPEMFDRFRDNRDVWFTILNGTHVDSLNPAIVTRWAEFLDLFVARRVPRIPALAYQFSDVLYGAIAAGAGAARLPATRFDQMSFDTARAEFRKDPRVRVLFDNGGATDRPGALDPQWELGFDSWPPREARPAVYHLGPGGTLDASRPARAERVTYTSDPAARPRTSLAAADTGAAWAAFPPYRWEPVAGGKGIGFTSAPLANDVVAVGPASVDLDLSSTAADTDLQVTISDVRPDGQEMYVQTGWLRASHRSLDRARSTVLDPVPTHLRRDARPLTTGKPTRVRVAVPPIAFAFRAGHRIRLTITAPGGDRPLWAFQTAEDGRTRNTVLVGADSGSRLVLPVLAGRRAGGVAPPCPSNRGQPCRAFVAAGNGG